MAATVLLATALTAPSSATKERVVEARWDNLDLSPGKLEAAALRGETTVLLEVYDDTGIPVIGSVEQDGDNLNFCGSLRMSVRAGQRVVLGTAYGVYGVPPTMPCPQGVAGDFRATFS